MNQRFCACKHCGLGFTRWINLDEFVLRFRVLGSIKMSGRFGDCLKTICLTFVYISNWYKSRTKVTLCCESTQIIQVWVRLLCRFCCTFMQKNCNKQNLKHEGRFWKNIYIYICMYINYIIRNIYGSRWTIGYLFLFSTMPFNWAPAMKSW